MKRMQLLMSGGYQVAAVVLARQARSGFRDTRRTGDNLEVADALANAAVVGTGTAILLRSLRWDRS